MHICPNNFTKNQRNKTKIFSRNYNSLIKDGIWSRSKSLTNTQLNKLKYAAKNKAGTTLRITKKNFQGEELNYELFLKTRQETRIKQAFANNMSIDMKLSKFQISKIIQSGGTFGSWLVNLGKRTLANVAISFTRDILFELVSNIASNAINKFESKRSRKEAVRAGKGFALFISSEDIDDKY